MSLALQAVDHLLQRIKRDPRLAYYFDEVTQSAALLTAAHAEARGLNVEEFRQDYFTGMRFEAPLCRECRTAA